MHMFFIGWKHKQNGLRIIRTTMRWSSDRSTCKKFIAGSRRITCIRIWRPSPRISYSCLIMHASITIRSRAFTRQALDILLDDLCMDFVKHKFVGCPDTAKNCSGKEGRADWEWNVGQITGCSFCTKWADDKYFHHSLQPPGIPSKYFSLYRLHMIYLIDFSL